MQVKLISQPDMDLRGLMSQAARTCYEDKEPTGDKIINIEERIFDTGHHTVLQHPHFTFFIEGIPIGNITLGLHLNMPFYVSSQRSGRFCFGMFNDPDIIEWVMKHISKFFPETSDNQCARIKRYIQNCQRTFSTNLDRAISVAEKFIAEERPHASAKYIGQNAKKFAQEQLRACIPVIFPTAVTFTTNLSVLAALYKIAAYDPVMVHLTNLMAQEILAQEPRLVFMFKRQDTPRPEDRIPLTAKPGYMTHPYLTLMSTDDLNRTVYPAHSDMHPMDTLHFDPHFMFNNVIDITTEVNISLATMGQDQRHRQIRRGLPIFTGDIYCPPIAYEMGIADQLLRILAEWMSFSDLHLHLFKVLAPYGAMVSYIKKGNLNAIFHEQSKRTCWCTQQEIYEISRQLRNAIDSQTSLPAPYIRALYIPELLSILAPPCFQTGECGEGVRYCGRDLIVDRNNFFPERKV